MTTAGRGSSFRLPCYETGKCRATRSLMLLEKREPVGGVQGKMDRKEIARERFVLKRQGELIGSMANNLSAPEQLQFASLFLSFPFSYKHPAGAVSSKQLNQQCLQERTTQILRAEGGPAGAAWLLSQSISVMRTQYVEGNNRSSGGSVLAHMGLSRLARGVKSSMPAWAWASLPFCPRPVKVWVSITGVQEHTYLLCIAGILLDASRLSGWYSG